MNKKCGSTRFSCPTDLAQVPEHLSFFSGHRSGAICYFLVGSCITQALEVMSLIQGSV